MNKIRIYIFECTTPYNLVALFLFDLRLVTPQICTHISQKHLPHQKCSTTDVCGIHTLVYSCPKHWQHSPHHLLSLFLSLWMD